MTVVALPFRLNRTSVGLKPKPISQIEETEGRPQSNQRGIETRLMKYTRG